MTYVGIDVSKATFMVAYSSAKSGKTKSFKVSSDRMILHSVHLCSFSLRGMQQGTRNGIRIKRIKLNWSTKM